METLAKSLPGRCFKHKLQGEAYIYIEKAKVSGDQFSGQRLEVDGEILLSIFGRSKRETIFSWRKDSRVYSGEDFLGEWEEISDMEWKEIKLRFLQNLIDELF